MNDSSNRYMRGQALLPFALVTPILLLIMFSVIDFGRVFYNQVSGPAVPDNPPIGCYNLALDSSPIYGGDVVVVDPGMLCPEDDLFFDEGAVVTFLAIPASGYNFIQWIDDASGTNITGTVTMTEDKSVTAVFESPLECLFLDASVTPTDTAGMILPVTHYSCEEDFRAGWLDGTLVWLNAIPNSGYSFVDWSGDANGSNNPVDVLLTGRDQQITANFVADGCYPLAVTPIPAAGGSYEAAPAENCPGGWLDGTAVTFNALPNSGYTFNSWEGYAVGVNPITMTMAPTQTSYIDLYFESPLECNFLDASVIPYSAAGAILPITPFNCEEDFRDGWLDGTLVRLNAIPSAGYSFIEWSGDANGSNSPIDVLFIGGDQQITARFSCDDCNYVFLPMILKQ